MLPRLSQQATTYPHPHPHPHCWAGHPRVAYERISPPSALLVALSAEGSAAAAWRRRLVQARVACPSCGMPLVRTPLDPMGGAPQPYMLTHPQEPNPERTLATRCVELDGHPGGPQCSLFG